MKTIFVILDILRRKPKKNLEIFILRINLDALNIQIIGIQKFLIWFLKKIDLDTLCTWMKMKRITRNKRNSKMVLNLINNLIIKRIIKLKSFNYIII